MWVLLKKTPYELNVDDLAKLAVCKLLQLAGSEMFSWQVLGYLAGMAMLAAKQVPNELIYVTIPKSCLPVCSQRSTSPMNRIASCSSASLMRAVSREHRLLNNTKVYVQEISRP